MGRYTVYGPLDCLWSVDVLWPASPFMVRYVGYGPLDRLWLVIPLVSLTVGPFDRGAYRQFCRGTIGGYTMESFIRWQLEIWAVTGLLFQSSLHAQNFEVTSKYDGPLNCY
jgi:hypothetical protein